MRRVWAKHPLELPDNEKTYQPEKVAFAYFHFVRNNQFLHTQRLIRLLFWGKDSHSYWLIIFELKMSNSFRMVKDRHIQFHVKWIKLYWVYFDIEKEKKKILPTAISLNASVTLTSNCKAEVTCRPWWNSLDFAHLTSQLHCLHVLCVHLFYCSVNSTWGVNKKFRITLM